MSNGPIVHVLGAGVDKPHGMPLANDLLSEIAKFAENEGKPVDQALRRKLPRLRFNLAKYAGEQGETFAERLLTDEPQSLNVAKKKLFEHLESNENATSVRAFLKVIDSLEAIRDNNQLQDDTLLTLARLGGEEFQASGGDYILDPKKVHFVPIVRQAFRKTFQKAIRTEKMTSSERDKLMELALYMMDVEDLLGSLFSGFYTNHLPGQKNYLYMSWLLWSYLRVQMNRSHNDRSTWPYNDLTKKYNYITLNYTAEFFDEQVRDKVKFFHGNCLSYIRLDRRQLINNDARIRSANSPDALADFISSLEMDLESRKIFLPSIIPPLPFKPLMCNEHLDTWYNCGKLFNEAAAIIITGYSFALADEHFNDLLRKYGNGYNRKILIINPNIDIVSERVLQVLGKDPIYLTNVSVDPFDNCRTIDNIVFIEAGVESLEASMFDQLLA